MSPGQHFQSANQTALFLNVLILSLLGGARHSGHNQMKEVGGVRRGCRDGSCGKKAWENVLPVEMSAPFPKFIVVRGDGEMSFGDLSLVHAEAPKVELVNVCIDFCLVETLVLVIGETTEMQNIF